MSHLKDEPEYRHLLTRLIHSLIQVDPKERDPEEAKRILKQLEAWEPL